MSEPENRHIKILIITRNLPPLVGGMERLNWNMAKGLADKAQVTLVGPRIAKDCCPPNVQFFGAPLKPLWLFLIFAQINALYLAIKSRPNIVIAGSGLTAPVGLICARLIGAKAITYTHGLDVALSHPLYKMLWLPCLRYMNTVIANSIPTQNLLIERNVKKEKITVIHPGVDIPETQPTEIEIEIFKHKYNLTNGPTLLSVGRLTTRKGLKEFIANSLGDIAKEFPNVKLLIIGEAPKNSLYAKPQTKEEIQQEAKNLGLEEHIIFTGNITDLRTLQTAYAASDLHIFPVRNIPGDPEGFGMVAIEAAAHGLPTIVFSSGGTIDSVKEGTSGHLVETNNYPRFTSQVLEALQHSMAAEGIYEFSKKFSWPQFQEKIWEIFQHPRK